MALFSVWSPDARSMHVETHGERFPMRRDEGGWWRADVAAAGPGSDYRFVVNEGEAFPDPRSASQPHGVHGPSRVVDHGGYAWSDDAFSAPPLSSAVLHELHIGTFTALGTFDGAIARLDHLVELGVTHVELLPVQEFSGARGWGYDGVDLYAPHHAYGGPEGLKRLVDACHARGLGVVLDVVYNHLGPSGNYLARFGPYFSEKYQTPWGPAVNLDEAGSDGVRRFFLDNALMWLRDYHVDGLRLDAVHAIYDQSAVSFLEELASEVRALSASLGRHLVLIAESDLNDPRVVHSPDAGGYGIDAQWSDDFHHALHAVLTGERAGYYADFGGLSHLAKALTNAFVYDGSYSRFRQRTHGRPVAGLSGHHFLAYLQNHDQVGNRARGDRLSQLTTTGRLKVGAALLLTSPFVPMLFQGEEWGCTSTFAYFTAHEEEELAEAVRRGRRAEFAAFGWAPDDIPDPQALTTFERSRLAWEERQREPHASLLAWHRALLALRRSTPDLTDGRLERVKVAYDEDARWFRMERGTVVVAVSFATERQRVPLDPRRRYRVLLSSEDSVDLDPSGAALEPDAVVVLATATFG